MNSTSGPASVRTFGSALSRRSLARRPRGPLSMSRIDSRGSRLRPLTITRDTVQLANLLRLTAHEVSARSRFVFAPDASGTRSSRRICLQAIERTAVHSRPPVQIVRSSATASGQTWLKSLSESMRSSAFLSTLWLVLQDGMRCRMKQRVSPSDGMLCDLCYTGARYLAADGNGGTCLAHLAR